MRELDPSLGQGECEDRGDGSGVEGGGQGREGETEKQHLVRAAVRVAATMLSGKGLGGLIGVLTANEKLCFKNNLLASALLLNFNKANRPQVLYL